MKLTSDQAVALAHLVVSLREYQPESTKTRICALIELQVDPLILYEAVLQSYLFYGFPAAIEGLRALQELIPTLSEHTNLEPWHNSGTHWQERGEQTCQLVYRHHFHTLVSRLRTITPELTEWMIVEGYGKVLGRPGIDLALREFLISAMLSVTTFSRQLEAHLHGCKNVGVNPEWLHAWFQSPETPTTQASQAIWTKCKPLFQ